MKKYIEIVLVSLVVISLSVLGFVFVPPVLDDLQMQTLFILLIVCGGSALYCFVVGEITRNNSQMDKLWSLLPIAYTWIIAAKGNMNVRLVIFAVITTLWGLRLTFNFARKGAYKLKFWAGEEDYRWSVLRSNKPFTNKAVWALFNLFFISIYQNVLVLAICLPSLAMMNTAAPLHVMDIVATFLAIMFLLLESIADEQQMFFHTTKRNLLNEGKTLKELPAPFNKGFNTIGLWKRSRHPNYLGEQGIWLSLYLFTIGAGITKFGIFHWSMIGPLFLVFLFLGSVSLQESISSSKYEEYSNYTSKVFKYLPIKKYKD